jgi:hypothetical protein
MHCLQRSGGAGAGQHPHLVRRGPWPGLLSFRRAPERGGPRGSAETTGGGSRRARPEADQCARQWMPRPAGSGRTKAPSPGAPSKCGTACNSTSSIPGCGCATRRSCTPRSSLPSDRGTKAGPVRITTPRRDRPHGERGERPTGRSVCAARAPAGGGEAPAPENGQRRNPSAHSRSSDPGRGGMSNRRRRRKTASQHPATSAGPALFA